MVFCPECKTDWEDDFSECPVCGRELRPIEIDTEAEWVLLGAIEDNLSAEYARETLESYDIPCVVIAKSGFLGQVGLPINPIYSKDQAQFEISVPTEFVEEAAGILDMVLGRKWRRKEE